MLSSKHELIVPFHDVDSMHIVWHGHYVKYFELARCQLLDSFNYGYQQMFDSGYAWPVVDMRVKYIKPIRFDQKIRVTATLVDWEFRLNIKYSILDIKSNETLTKGSTIQVALCMRENEMCYVTPEVFRNKLGVAL